MVPDIVFQGSWSVIFREVVLLRLILRPSVTIGGHVSFETAIWGRDSNIVKGHDRAPMSMPVIQSHGLAANRSGRISGRKHRG